MQSGSNVSGYHLIAEPTEAPTKDFEIIYLVQKSLFSISSNILPILKSIRIKFMNTCKHAN